MSKISKALAFISASIICDKFPQNGEMERLEAINDILKKAVAQDTKLKFYNKEIDLSDDEEKLFIDYI